MYVDLEISGRETTVVYFRVIHGHSRKGLRKDTANLSQDDLCPDRVSSQ
jgi:hypothetical protein